VKTPPRILAGLSNCRPITELPSGIVGCWNPCLTAKREFFFRRMTLFGFNPHQRLSTINHMQRPQSQFPMAMGVPMNQDPAMAEEHVKGTRRGQHWAGISCAPVLIVDRPRMYPSQANTDAQIIRSDIMGKFAHALLQIRLTKFLVRSCWFGQ